MNICFDTDECLIDKGKPIKANIALLKVLSKSHKVYVWSGNGYVHSFGVVMSLGLEKNIDGVLNKYGTFVPDVAFDNQEIDLGKLNIKV